MALLLWCNSLAARGEQFCKDHEIMKVFVVVFKAFVLCARGWLVHLVLDFSTRLERMKQKEIVIVIDGRSRIW